MNPELRQKLAEYLEQDQDFRFIYDYTKHRFEAATQLTAHNWEHAYRDTINAIAIGDAEGADMTIVLPGAVMHDIGFLYGATGRTHGSIGANKLSEYLAEANITLPKAKIDAIADCIRTHKGSMHGEVPETLEAKVVSDADMLEKFGPIGVYQGIRSFTEFNLSAVEIIERITNRTSLTFCTSTGEEMAQPLRAYDAEFAKALDNAYRPYREEKI